jgi:hypothetical protein
MYIRGDPTTISPTVEGFRMLNGDATGFAGSSIGNDAGGVLYLWRAAATISYCEISSGTAEAGGGVYVRHSPSTFNYNTIAHNSATGTASSNFDGGGGVYVHESDGVAFNNNKILNNTSLAHGGGMNVNVSYDTVLMGNTISDNWSNWGGGGVHLHLGSAKVSYNTISENRTRTYSGDGAGRYLVFGVGTLEGNAFVNNTAARKGGGLVLAGADETLAIGNTFIGNKAENEFNDGENVGGGLYLRHSNSKPVNNYFTRNQAQEDGNAVYVYRSSPRFKHNTVTKNHGARGVAIAVSLDSHPSMTNTIVASHTVGISLAAGSTAMMEATLWYANASDTDGAGTVDMGTINITANPRFEADGLHLQATSPAIDAGLWVSVAQDIDLQPRAMTCDIGADEYLWRVYLPIVTRES